MTLLAESRARAKRPPPLVEWHRWFAWYPVPTAIDGKLHYAWLQPVERKMGYRQIQRHNQMALSAA
jgi:hypothetical protein